MYVLKTKHNEFYKGMIAEMIPEIVRTNAAAKQFDNPDDACVERAKYDIYLNDFEVVKVD